jgi:hypothetical protein
MPHACTRRLRVTPVNESGHRGITSYTIEELVGLMEGMSRNDLPEGNRRWHSHGRHLRCRMDLGRTSDPIWWQMWQQRNHGGGTGASMVGSGSVLLAALIGFVLGFALKMWRAHWLLE